MTATFSEAGALLPESVLTRELGSHEGQKPGHRQCVGRPVFPADRWQGSEHDHVWLPVKAKAEKPKCTHFLTSDSIVPSETLITYG